MVGDVWRGWLSLRWGAASAAAVGERKEGRKEGRTEGGRKEEGRERREGGTKEKERGTQLIV